MIATTGRIARHTAGSFALFLALAALATDVAPLAAEPSQWDQCRAGNAGACSEIQHTLEKLCTEFRDAQACFQLGVVHFDGELMLPPNIKVGLMHIENACQLDYGIACRQLAHYYGEGKGVERDSKREAELHEKCCGLGQAVCCTMLGWNLANGHGMPADGPRGRGLLEKACDLDDGQGCFLLGSALQDGIGGRANDLRAKALFTKACGLRESRACEALSAASNAGAGELEQKNQQNLETLKAKCLAGNSSQCGLLGEAYAEGRGTDADAAAARRAWSKACKSGDSIACANLGRSWVPPSSDSKRGSLKKARKAFEAGCRLDSAMCCAAAGRSYLEGKPTKKQIVKAQRHLQRSCDLRSVKGCNDLATFFLLGDPSESLRQRAIESLQIACDNADGKSCARAATTIMGAYPPTSGAPVPKSTQEEIDRLRARACKLGVAAACANR